MPVAIHLVEVLTLITIVGILTAFSIFIVIAEKIVTISLFMFGVSFSDNIFPLFPNFPIFFSLYLKSVEHCFQPWNTYYSLCLEKF